MEPRRCPACGAIVAQRAQTCYMCGASLNRPWCFFLHIRWPRFPRLHPFRRDKDRRCPACGAKVSSTARTCTVCGAALRLRTAGHIRSIVMSIVPDLLLFVLVVLTVGLVIFGWRWRPQQANPSVCTHPNSPTAPIPVLLPTSTVVAPATSAPTATASPTPVPTIRVSATAVPATLTVTLPMPSPTAPPTPTRTSTVAPTINPAPSQVHTIVRGDTLNKIALQYGCDVQALIQANPGLDPQRLQIGQKILIPVLGLGGQAIPLETQILTHTVQAGQTLSEIAAEYGTTLNDIYALNPGVSPQFLRAGQVLRIKLGPPTPTPTSTSTPTATPLPYAAPALLWPAEGEEFRGPDSRIVLQWTSAGILGEKEWYVVRMSHAEREIEHRTKVPSWQMPAEMYPDASESPLFRWSILVKRMNGSPEGQPVSPPSDTRSFLWR